MILQPVLIFNPSDFGGPTSNPTFYICAPTIKKVFKIHPHHLLWRLHSENISRTSQTTILNQHQSTPLYLTHQIITNHFKCLPLPLPLPSSLTKPTKQTQNKRTLNRTRSGNSISATATVILKIPPTTHKPRITAHTHPTPPLLAYILSIKAQQLSNKKYLLSTPSPLVLSTSPLLSLQ